MMILKLAAWSRGMEKERPYRTGISLVHLGTCNVLKCNE